MGEEVAIVPWLGQYSPVEVRSRSRERLSSVLGSFPRFGGANILVRIVVYASYRLRGVKAVRVSAALIHFFLNACHGGRRCRRSGQAGSFCRGVLFFAGAVLRLFC